MSSRTDRAFDILRQRTVWETKQRVFYTMRHDGVRRANKPFPTAADLHFPLIDNILGDLKPFWSSQVFGGDRLTDFVAMREQLSNMTEACADYLDFKLRYDPASQFRLRFEKMFDTMLLRGRGVTLSTVDPFNKYRYKFKNIDPQYLLMPEMADEFDDADFWVWVQRISVDQYRRDRNLNRDSQLIEKIRGQAPGYDFTQQLQEKQLREGVTHSHKSDEIILWNHVERTASGLLWTTYSPQDPDQQSGIIRKPFYVPYKINGEVSNPFHSFIMEVKDDGWYSPRGVAELNAAFEAFCTKCWNEESDFMTFGNRPIFTSDSPLNNASNDNWTPGSYVPGNVKAVALPPPPVSFAEKINFARGLAVARTKVPDMGQFDENKGPSQPITATQARTEAGMQSVTTDHSGDVFRMTRMVPFYRHVWALTLHATECQKQAGQPPELIYFVSNNLKTLPAEALHDQYLVLPAGGNANKQQRIMVANQLYQNLKGNPNVKQDELVKNLIAAYDSRLNDKLYIPTGLGQQNEAYLEDVELMVLSEGRPVPVLPGQDHATRAMEDANYLHAQHVKGTQANPQAAALISQHLQQHLAYLKQTNPEAFKQVTQQIAQMSAPQQPMNANGAPSGSTPGAPGGAPPAPSGQGGEQKSPSESISVNLKDLYPSERQQALKMFGIVAAQPQEMIQTEAMKAQLKNAGKPAPEPQEQSFGK